MSYDPLLCKLMSGSMHYNHIPETLESNNRELKAQCDYNPVCLYLGNLFQVEK